MLPQALETKRMRICGGILALVALVSAACTGTHRKPEQSQPIVIVYDAISPGFFNLPPGARPVNLVRRSRFHDARPSYAWRIRAGKKELIAFSSQIQHVVLIYMENRTPENLFGAYFDSPNPSTGHTLGSDLDLVDPASVHLTPKPLNAGGNPNHDHEPGFTQNAMGTYPPPNTGYWYVETPGPTTTPPSVANYIMLIEKWAYENHTLQSNEGPSFEAHQYAIAGQSGGLSDSDITPTGMVNNPSAAPGAAGTSSTATPDDVVGTGTCFAGTSEFVAGVDMRNSYPGNGELPTPTASPCNEYKTLPDLMASAAPMASPYFQWQYVAKDAFSIWSAPMAVRHLYNEYIATAPQESTQPFAVDPDAENFVLNVTGSTVPTPNPARPFAELTYLTPCLRESDHPNTTSISDGPQWLAYVLNAIGSSSYWSHTAIIVTWDDWGGFYDNYTPAPWPYHPTPPPSPYNSLHDPNEWGYRVPLIVISPYVKSRGYISTKRISQGAILNFIESTFDLSPHALGGDDASNGDNDLSDMFDFSRVTLLPWIPFPSPSFTPANHGVCPTNPP